MNVPNSDDDPHRETIVRTMEILREYCLNDNPVQLEVLSDQTVNFPRFVPVFFSIFPAPFS